MKPIEPFDQLRHLPKFSGFLWYVNGATGADTNNGWSPTTAFATIGAALAAAAAGDSIIVSSGTYDENGLAMSVNGLKLFGEHGVGISDTTTGAQTLLISADFCRVEGIRISQAGQVGLSITGDNSWIEEVNVHASSTAFSVAGDLNVLQRTVASTYSATGYDIAGARNVIRGGSAVGALGATRGVYLSAATADYNTILGVNSSGNGTSSFEVVTGCANNTIKDCSSGDGDGRWVDADRTTIFSGFTFQTPVISSITLAGAGDYNIFKVTGAVQVNYLWGVVTTPIAAATTGANLNLFPTGGAAIPITLAAGPAISSFPVNSLLAKANLATVAMVAADSSLGFISEVAGNIFAEFSIGQAGATDTHIRLSVGGAGGAGVIQWQCDWEPLSDDGFLEPA